MYQLPQYKCSLMSKKCYIKPSYPVHTLMCVCQKICFSDMYVYPLFLSSFHFWGSRFCCCCNAQGNWGYSSSAEATSFEIRQIYKIMSLTDFQRYNFATRILKNICSRPLMDTEEKVRLNLQPPNRSFIRKSSLPPNHTVEAKHLGKKVCQITPKATPLKDTE